MAEINPDILRLSVDRSIFVSQAQKRLILGNIRIAYFHKIKNTKKEK